MTEDDRKSMESHGITIESKDLYNYKGFRYERLEDAIRYAEIDTERPDSNAPPVPKLR